MIKQNVEKVLAELPPSVQLVAAVKSRTPQEILEAVAAGVGILGSNYVKEAEVAQAEIGSSPSGKKVSWHFIGHLQTNKAKKAVEVFDLIETVDSEHLAQAINRQAAKIGKVMPVLIEINSAREVQKSGVLPEAALALIKNIASLDNIRVMGLMTMGPFSENAENLRPAFVLTKNLFDELRQLAFPRVEMRFLSMGMSDSYAIAIESGANLIRLGTKLFGPR